MPMIRRARPDDVADLIDLNVRTIRASYAPFLGTEIAEQYIQSGAVESFFGESLDRTVVILDEDRLAGCAVSRDDFLEQLMIDHRHHRRGLGSVLLARVEADLFTRRDVIRLDSFEDNAVANAFYASHGWAPGRRHSDPEWGLRMVTLTKSR